MRKLLNDLSIRGKLVLLISGCVCVLTAAVLTVVWVQSLRQVRAIVQDQLAANRQLFASTERSHYQSRVYKGTALASSPAVARALERNDQSAACAFLSRLRASPSVGPNDDDLDYVSTRRPMARSSLSPSKIIRSATRRLFHGISQTSTKRSPELRKLLPGPVPTTASIAFLRSPPRARVGLSASSISASNKMTASPPVQSFAPEWTLSPGSKTRITVCASLASAIRAS